MKAWILVSSYGAAADLLGSARYIVGVDTMLYHPACELCYCLLVVCAKYVVVL